MSSKKSKGLERNIKKSNQKIIEIQFSCERSFKTKKINSKYRKINKPTNVLSFPQNEKRMISNFENYLVLGDIVISLEKILSEANDQKKKFF